MNYAPTDDTRVIYHEGVAEEVGENSAVVRFVQNGACGSCQLKSVCNPGEQKVRLVTAFHDGSIRAGQNVRVCVEESVAWLSILFSFALPFVFLTGAFFGTILLGGGETLAGLLGLGSVPIYYGLLYLVRAPLGRRVAFTALPSTNQQLLDTDLGVPNEWRYS